MSKVGVLGAGAWGTAIAMAAQRAGSQVILWTQCPQEAARIAQTHQSTRLPGIAVPRDMTITSDLEVVCEANILVLAVPAQAVRGVLMHALPYLQESTYLVIAAKGIEIGSHLLMSEVIAQMMPQAGIAVLSGPSFADEVAQGLPTAITLAAQNIQTATYLSTAFNSDTFRVYASDDIVGTQLGGALKNVLAIGTGIARGMGLGSNTEAALITRGIVEIGRLACARGARGATLNGLSGVGDIVLTCANPKSRNMSFGMRVGQGETPEHIVENAGKTFEGFATAQSVGALAQEAGVEMPICQTIQSILGQEITPREGIQRLMQRPMKPELDH